MTYLLDTQIALWLFLDSPRLPKEAKALLSATGAIAIFHQTSTWEVQIKYDLSKLPLPERPEQCLPRWIESSGLSRSPIEDAAIYLLGKLPPIHRDPFDRLLIAHSILRGWPLITADPVFAEYPVVIANR